MVSIMLSSCKLLKTNAEAEDDEIKAFKDFHLDDSTYQLSIKCPNSNKRIPLVNYEKHIKTKGDRPLLAFENYHLALYILDTNKVVVHKYLFDSAIMDFCNFDFPEIMPKDFELGILEGSDLEIIMESSFTVNIVQNPIRNGFLEFTVHCNPELFTNLSGEILNKEGNRLINLNNLSLENRIDIKSLTQDQIVYLVIKSNHETMSYKIAIYY